MTTPLTRDFPAGTSASPPAIKISHLSKTYGTFTAVNDVSLTVRAGSVFALLGTNGAGKTSTIDLMTGMLAPSGGSVQVFGVDPYHDRAKISDRIGIMLQEAGFLESLTVRETIIAWRRFTPRARSLEESLEMVSLRRQAKTPVGRLSGGERRRLDLALALLGHPELLFLDEPTTGLDPAARQHTWELLGDMVSDGLTVVLTTHYMEEAERLADDVAIMDAGRIVTEGTLADITTASGTRISVELASDVEAHRLSIPVGASATVSGRRVDIDTGDPQNTLLTLLQWAQRAGFDFDSIRVGASTLEDAFLATLKTAEARQ